MSDDCVGGITENVCCLTMRLDCCGLNNELTSSTSAGIQNHLVVERIYFIPEVRKYCDG